MIKQLAKLGAKGFIDNQKNTVFSTTFNTDTGNNVTPKISKNKEINKKEDNKDNKNNLITVKIDTTTNWGDLKNKIISNNNKILINLGLPSNETVECFVDLSSFDAGQKEKKIDVSLTPEYSLIYSIIKYVNPKYNKTQDLIVPKNKQLQNKNLKNAKIGYQTFYEEIELKNN